jgi:hypothetical protein
MRHLSHSPIVESRKPIVTPHLSPYLSRMKVDGKFTGMKSRQYDMLR